MCFVLHSVLTCLRQESANERYCSTVKDFLLSNTISQKDEKLHIAGLDETALLHVKIFITKILHEKKLNIVNPNVPLCTGHKMS